jgi:NAD(P)H-dependent FMN reductase
MAELRIAILVGSTRPTRNGEAVARWVLEQAAGRPGATYELLDLADFPLPPFDEAVSPAYVPSTRDDVVRWAETVAAYDGFVFVTPEYNHSIPGALKNAMDYLYAEWNNKAAAFVAYGSMGGARAVEHLRGIASELQLAHVRQQLGFSLFTDFEQMRRFTPGPQHADAAQAMFDQLETWALAMRSVREGVFQAA